MNRAIGFLGFCTALLILTLVGASICYKTLEQYQITKAQKEHHAR